jgi:hypothetical protein
MPSEIRMHKKLATVMTHPYPPSGGTMMYSSFSSSLLVCLGHFLVFSAFIFFHKLFNTKPDQKYFKWYDVGLFAVTQILIRFNRNVCRSSEFKIRFRFVCLFFFGFFLSSFFFRFLFYENDRFVNDRFRFFFQESKLYFSLELRNCLY